jgi:tetratricopeptide (TPR) repeat protein
MSKWIPGFGLSQGLTALVFLFVAGLLSVLGYRLWPPGGPPTVRSRFLLRAIRPEEPRGANLVLITIDGLRADRVGIYDPSGPSVTRHIDALGRDGFRFEQVVTASPSTFPAHAALMTGLPPSVTRAISPIAGRLPDGNRTLAEILREAGFRTAAFVGSGALGRASGLAQGFDTFDGPRTVHLPVIVRGMASRPAGEVIDAARAWVDDNFRTRFFLWIQLSDLPGSRRPPASYLRLHDDRYEATIAYSDAELGHLLARLESLGVLGRTIVAISASHGLGLGDHDEIGSGALLYDGTVLVPMLLRLPQESVRDRSIPEQVRLIDLMPTFFDLLGIEPQTSLRGTSLVPLLDPGGRLAPLPAVSTTAFQEVFLGGSRLEALRAQGWKYVDGLAPELYDLRRDRGELQNLAASLPDRVLEMRGTLGEATGQAIMGGARRPPRGMRALELVETGIQELRAGNGERAHWALRELIRILEAEGPDATRPTGAPHAPGLLALLGASLRLQGRPTDALQRYEEGLAVLGESLVQDRILEGLLHAEMGACRRGIGDLEKAVISYRRSIDLLPDDPDVRRELASLYLERGALREAIAEFRAALARSPGDPDILAGLGRAHLEDGDAPAAVQSLQRAVRLAPSDARPYLDLARASEALHRRADAVRAYREYLARAEATDIQERRIARERLQMLEGSGDLVR